LRYYESADTVGAIVDRQFKDIVMRRDDAAGLADTVIGRDVLPCFAPGYSASHLHPTMLAALRLAKIARPVKHVV